MQNNFELVVKWLDIEDLLHLEQTCKYFKNYKELWNWYFYYFKNKQKYKYKKMLNTDKRNTLIFYCTWYKWDRWPIEDLITTFSSPKIIKQFLITYYLFKPQKILDMYKYCCHERYIDSYANKILSRWRIHLSIFQYFITRNDLFKPAQHIKKRKYFLTNDIENKMYHKRIKCIS